ncbi:hypothetical protein ACROYT_G016338 [Oculina patagonica]
MENDLSSLNESFEDITLEDSNPSCSTPRRSLAFKHDLTPTSKAKGQPAHKTVRIGPSDLKREMLQCCMEMDNEIVELLYVLGVGEEFKKSLVTRQIAQLFPNSSKTRIRTQDEITDLIAFKGLLLEAINDLYECGHSQCSTEALRSDNKVATRNCTQALRFHIHN